MLKLITFQGQDESGNVFVQAIKPSGSLTKIANKSRLTPEIQSHISAIRPDGDHVYVLVNALGAGEYYGSNINGDYFEEHELRPTESTDLHGYKSFLNAGIYRHHKNKDKSISMGEVVCACYNSTMHRVELILKINKARAAEVGHSDLVRKLESGGNPAVSMGCKVKYDVCSICGHKSKTRADYCEHARGMMGKILPDGRKVFVYNPRPRFFDISFVVVGADRTSYAMAKVASALPQLSADAADEAGLRDGVILESVREKLASKRKISAILKELPAMSARVMPRISRGEPDISNSLIDMLARHPVKSALTSTSAAGIVLKPREYQRLILLRVNKRPLADKLDRMGLSLPYTSKVDNGVSFGNPMDYSPSIGSLLRDIIPERSAFAPAVTKRITIIRIRPMHSGSRVMMKLGSFESLSAEEKALLRTVSAGYNGYRVQLMEKISSIAECVTANEAELLASINSSGLEDAFLGGFAKEAAVSPAALLGIIPLTYLYGAHVSKRERAGQSVGPLDNFVSKHPVTATAVFVGLTRLGANLQRKGVFKKLMDKID